MAVENIGESQDEKEILIKKDALSQDSGEVVEKTKNKESKLILYHWTQSFSSQKVRLAIAEKGLQCEEYDVSLPLSEHNEPWFMRLNPTGEVPVLVHNDNVICDPTQIMDYLEQNFCDEHTPKLIPEEGSTYYHRVQHYRELLDSLQMDAYTHGCILHPEITVDSHIPAYATTHIRTQILNTESELKKLAAENPDLKDAYIAKQRRLKSKLFDHDNMKYLKKLLDELENVLDQVETELQRRIEETPGGRIFLIIYVKMLKRCLWAKKKAPAFVGATLLVGLIGGATYLAFTYFKRRLLMS
uniref:Ganglioside-induced differentiation-associated protein 1-like n=1 Tax=Sinocyclocheilus rhinocerous TaxID=307959 RepID=A0A673GCF4_9TELE